MYTNVYGSYLNLLILLSIMNTNYLYIIIGAIIAFYANANEDQNVLLLAAGVIILLFGIYKLQATIPSKQDKKSFIESEPVDEEE